MRILHRKFPFRPSDNSLFGRHLTRKILLCIFVSGLYDIIAKKAGQCKPEPSGTKPEIKKAATALLQRACRKTAGRRKSCGCATLSAV
jgi:hypothetical protein